MVILKTHEYFISLSFQKGFEITPPNVKKLKNEQIKPASSKHGCGYMF